MSTTFPEMHRLHHEALQRHARKRLDDLEDIRAATQAKTRGLTQREIAELLVTSQARVHRLLKAAARQTDINEKMPEEIILRAFVDEIPRSRLTDELKKFPYTHGEYAPYPHEGRIPGTWDQVVTAFVQELLSEQEFTEVRAAIER